MDDDDDDLQRRLAAYGRRRRATGYPDEEDPDFDPDPGIMARPDPNAVPGAPMPDLRDPNAVPPVPMPDAREVLRRLDGRRDEATGYPPAGTPQGQQFFQRGEPWRPQMQAEGEPTGPAPEAPGQPPQPDMPQSAYGQMGPQPAAPYQQQGPQQQQFDPSQFVQGLAPPPPIRIFRDGVEGGEELGSKGMSPAGGTYFGHMLRELEEKVQNHPHMTPEDKSRALRGIYESAATHILGVHPGQQQQMQQAPPSANQAQITARLDAGEDKLNQMQASGYFGENGHNSQEYFEAMAQIAQQRQAIKAKEIPPPPTPQETFDKQAIHLPNGMLMTPTYGAKGEQTGWKEHPNADAALTEKLLTANPGLSPYGAAQHIALMRAAAAGHPVTPAQEAEINRKYPLAGKGKQHAESFDDMPYKEADKMVKDEMAAAHKINPAGISEQQAIENIKRRQAAMKGQETTQSYPDFKPLDELKTHSQAMSELKADKGTSSISHDDIKNRMKQITDEHWKDWATSKDSWEAMHKTGMGLGAQRDQFLNGKIPAWKQKAGRNVGIVDSVEKAVRAYPGGPMTMPPNVRDDYVQALKFIKANIDPSVNVPDPSKIGAVDETKP